MDKNGRGEYFDSFGRRPNEHFEHYMNTNCRIWTFNRRQLQSAISSFCGFYCCVYVKLRSRKINMTEMVNMFTRDTGYNDMLVHGFVCNKILKTYMCVVILCIGLETNPHIPRPIGRPIGRPKLSPV